MTKVIKFKEWSDPQSGITVRLNPSKRATYIITTRKGAIEPFWSIEGLPSVVFCGEVSEVKDALIPFTLKSNKSIFEKTGLSPTSLRKIRLFVGTSSTGFTKGGNRRK